MKERSLLIVGAVWLKVIVLAMASALVVWPPKMCPFKLTFIVTAVLIGGGGLATLKLSRHILHESKTWTLCYSLLFFWGLVLAVRFAVDLASWTPIGGGWDGWIEAWPLELGAVFVVGVTRGVYSQRERSSVLEAPLDEPLVDLSPSIGEGTMHQ